MRKEWELAILEGDEEGLWMTCKLCGAVSKRYATAAVVQWHSKHLAKEHPEVVRSKSQPSRPSKVDRELTPQEQRLYRRQQEDMRRWGAWFRYGGIYQGMKTRVPADYQSTLHNLIDRMGAAPEWQAWWSPMGPPPHLTLEVVFEGRTGLRFGYKTRHRKSGDEVIATFAFEYDEHVALTAADARGHVESLMMRLAKSYKLGAPPHLPIGKRGN